MHLVYFFMFDALCAVAKVYGADAHKRKIGLIREIIGNQQAIEDALRAVYAEFQGEEFDARFLAREQKEFRAKRQKDTTLKMAAIVQDLNKDQIERTQKRNALLKKLLWGSCMLFIIYRKLKK